MTNMDLDLDGIFLQNSTFSYDDYEYKDDCPSGSHGVFVAVVIPVLYSLALVVGLLGNGLLLGVLVHKRQSWSVTDTFILHLGVADCLLLVTLPFWAAQAAQGERWSFGIPFCKIAGAVFNIHIYCRVLLLACISLDRYLFLVHSVQMFSYLKPQLVQASCLAAWLLSLVLSIPDWAFQEPVKDGSGGMTCFPNYSPVTKGQQLVSRLLYHVVAFLLPAVVLVFCYTCILLLLHRGPQGAKTQRAVRVIMLLVVVFFLFWTPYNITLMVDTVKNNQKMSADSVDSSCEKTRPSLEVGLTITSFLGCLHACLNPLLYFGLCRNFRKSVLEVLRFKKGEQADFKLSLWELGIGKEPLPAQEQAVFKQITTIEQQVQVTV